MYFLPIDKCLCKVQMSHLSHAEFIVCMYNLSLFVGKSYPIFIPIFLVPVLWHFPFPHGVSIYYLLITSLHINISVTLISAEAEAFSMLGGTGCQSDHFWGDV